MTVRSRPHLKTPPTTANPRALIAYLRSAHDANWANRHGKMDVTKSVTLTANAASTTVSDYRFSPQSFVWGMPTTANASAEIGAGTIYYAPTDGSCVITHANNANADRTFTLVILG